MTHTGPGGSGSPDSEPHSPPPPRDSLDDYDLEDLRYEKDDRTAGIFAGMRGPVRKDVPSQVSARYLFPTEKYRGEWRRHWVHLLPWYIIGAFSTLTLGFVAGLFLRWESDARDMALSITIGVWLVFLGIIGWKLIDWYMDRFILTNKRIMLVQGVVTREVAMMPLARVTDMKYAQTPMGRMFNYGTFIVESAGQDQALREVAHLPNPNELYLQMVEEMYEPEAVDEREEEEEIELLGNDGPEGQRSKADDA
ncbi:PH domain-containing protein [Haloglycomyces albus]|uniref:PH domain-containing protein n=1 Tax=Haloglycomyces albus TaxID=526067 RepID=UPI00046D04E2|nr:PH domain-containing protein [Haloglycomyces albus]